MMLAEFMFIGDVCFSYKYLSIVMENKYQLCQTGELCCKQKIS